MKGLAVIPLMAVASAIVLPNEQIPELRQVAKEARHGTQEILDKVRFEFISIKEEVAPIVDEWKSKGQDVFEDVTDKAKNAIDAALASAEDKMYTAKEQIPEFYFDAQAWVDSAKEHVEWSGTELLDKLSNRPHEEDAPVDSDCGHHHHPHHPPHHGHKSELTVYQLINESKYTTHLAKLINEHKDIVEALNSTKDSFTVFAPIDSAFEKIPKKAPKASKELVKKLLQYHVSPEPFPLSGILQAKTIPTLLHASLPGPQRLATQVGLRGLTVNFYSRIVAINVYGSNGVIHGVNNIIIPPPMAKDIIGILPIEFSTLTLGLAKTGLYLNDTKAHNGGTLFAPSNWAFLKLGHIINAFLFSPPGKPYLKALLKYHIVRDKTLYSDAFYDGSKSNKSEGGEVESIPRGYYHYTLPTLLDGKPINVDIRRFGRLIDIKLNAFTTVSVSDGVAYDGVIHALSDVLLPPKGKSSERGWFEKEWHGGEISLDEFKQRLEPFIPEEELSENVPEDL